MNIFLAIPTTGIRSESLSACLTGVRDLKVPAGVRLHTVLVQNGRAAAGDGLGLSGFSGMFEPGLFSHIAEPREGIPFARNAALRYAINNDGDYLAFIDDDAAPDPAWLDQLVSGILIPGVDAATGPQIPIFPDDAPEHLRNAEIHRERRLPEGSVCKWAATNNVMFSTAFAKKNDLWFNETFLTGGSDKEFFLRFTRSGGVIAWKPGAIVREPVVRSRLTDDWAVQRAYRYGATGFRIERSIRPAIPAAIVCIAKGAVYVATGIVRLPLALVQRRTAWIDGVCRIAHGTGFVLGIGSIFRLRRYA